MSSSWQGGPPIPHCPNLAGTANVLAFRPTPTNPFPKLVGVGSLHPSVPRSSVGTRSASQRDRDNASLIDAAITFVDKLRVFLGLLLTVLEAGHGIWSTRQLSDETRTLSPTPRPVITKVA